MKALILLKSMKEYFGSSQVLIQTQVDEAIKELEAIKKNIDTSIEEIEYALAKPEYAINYQTKASR